MSITVEFPEWERDNIIRVLGCLPVFLFKVLHSGNLSENLNYTVAVPGSFSKNFLTFAVVAEQLHDLCKMLKLDMNKPFYTQAAALPFSCLLPNHERKKAGRLYHGY